jgi:hypothetical protein
MTARLFRFQGKGLSIAQPWASAVAFAGKAIENRSWRTHYRGPLAIHPGGTVFSEYLDWLCWVVRGGEKRRVIDWINRGRRRYGLEPETADTIVSSHIVAIAMLVALSRNRRHLALVANGSGCSKALSQLNRSRGLGASSTWECKFNYRPLG